MLKLTLEHINQIRTYFLATTEEEKLGLQRNIIPTFLAGLLNNLRQLFIYNPNDENKLVSIAKSVGAEEHIDALKEIQQDYYSHLAAVFNSGHSNVDIDQLLKVNNSLFINEITFQLDIQKSFRQSERTMLKKKFREIDGVNELDDSELTNSFRQKERKKLKEQFKKIDKGIYDQVLEEDLMVAESVTEYKVSEQSKPSSNIRHLNWKGLAVAASIVSVIAIAGLFLVKSGKENSGIADKTKTDKVSEDSNQIRIIEEDRLKKLMADNQLPFSESKMQVLKEESFGFGEKAEEITVKVYLLNDKIAKFEKAFNKETHGGKEGEGSGRLALQKRIDSLNSLINTYKFKDGVLSVYLRAMSKLKIYKVSNEYFIKVNNSLNYMNKNNESTLFNKVNDNDVLESIEKIDFNQTN